MVDLVYDMTNGYTLIVLPSKLGAIQRDYVLHVCDNRKCVRLDHLFLGTPADNSADCVRKGRLIRGSLDSEAKLTEQAVIVIRERYAKGGITQRELAKEYGVSQTTIWLVLNRYKWRHVP